MIKVSRIVEFATSGWLVPTDEAARMLGCSRSRVRQIARAKGIRQFKMSDSGRAVFLDLGDVRRLAREPRTTGRPRSSNASD